MADNQSHFVPTPTPPFPSSNPWHSEQPHANLSFLHSRLCLQLSAPWHQLPPALLGEGAARDTEGCSFLVSKETKGRHSSIKKRNPAQGVLGNGVTSRAGPRAQHWGQLSSISLLLIWTRASRAPSARCQVTPGWLGVWLCWRAGSSAEGSGQAAAMGPGQLHEVHQGQGPAPALGSQPPQIPGWALPLIPAAHPVPFIPPLPGAFWDFLGQESSALGMEGGPSATTGGGTTTHQVCVLWGSGMLRLRAQ